MSSASKPTRTARTKLAPVKMLVLDVDGVLTDGRLYYGADGETLKVFNTLDGHGLKMLAASGVASAIISGRKSNALARRAKDLGIEHLQMGVADKGAAYCTLLKRSSLREDQIVAIGDDVVDLPILLRCAWSVAVPNAPADVTARVDMVTRARGGEGAVRELCEFIMRAQGTYDGILAGYIAG
jgi:3-deoxy-D-manno-octulosonate 8-phosphate phosphatase (KDO 8-P phosphatase)